jgi:hypothetical protein
MYFLTCLQCKCGKFSMKHTAESCATYLCHALLRYFFMCLCSAIYMSCIHELYTCDCSPLCFIYLCSCNLLVCCILVLMLVLCNLHELVVYMWLFTSVFHLLVQLQFTCVLHTCVNACALQFTWVSCIHVTVHLCVSYTCAVAIYLCAAYMCHISRGEFPS